MAKAIVCDRKGEVVGGEAGKLSVQLLNGQGVELVKAEGFDLCDPCVEMCYKIITERLLPHLVDKDPWVGDGA